MPMMPPTRRATPFALPSYEQQRKSPQERGYDAKWQAASQSWLRAFPWCLYCALEGRSVAATLVDHLYPHRGDRVLFWRKEFWVSSCATCHSSFKQSIERAGKAAIDALAIRLGRPIL